MLRMDLFKYSPPPAVSSEDLVTVVVWASLHRPLRSTRTEPLPRKLYVLLTRRFFFFKRFKLFEVVSSVSKICPSCPVHKTCRHGGEEERLESGDTDLPLGGGPRRRHVEVSRRGAGGRPAGRPTPVRVGGGHAHAGRIQLLEGESNVVVHLPAAGGWGGRRVGWDPAGFHFPFFLLNKGNLLSHDPTCVVWKLCVWMNRSPSTTHCQHECPTFSCSKPVLTRIDFPSRFSLLQLSGEVLRLSLQLRLDPQWTIGGAPRTGSRLVKIFFFLNRQIAKLKFSREFIQIDQQARQNCAFLIRFTPPPSLSL